jgi:type I restriction enzyme S subunit
MSSEFRTKVRLSDCAKFQEGYVNPSQKEPSYFGRDYKWLRATDLNDGFVVDTGRCISEKGFKSAGKAAVLFKPGTLAISKSGTIGRVGILKDYMCGNRAVINIDVTASCDTRFIFYTLLLNRKKIEQLAEGSVQKNLYISVLGSLEIELPTLAEQIKISAILGAIDDRVALLRETNATLEAIAQALFKSWFVDFDPVRAKAQGRDPEGLSAEVAGLFPNTLEMSSLGETPKGWKLVTLSEAYEINPSRKLPKGTVAPYLDMAKVQTSGHTVEQAVDRESGSGSKFSNGDTLLARITPCLENGKTAFVDFLKEGQVGWGSTEFVVLRPRLPLPVYHGYLLCRHDAFREHAIQSMSGTSGRQRIQNDVLGRYPVALATRRCARSPMS